MPALTSFSRKFSFTFTEFDRSITLAIICFWLAIGSCGDRLLKRVDLSIAKVAGHITILFVHCLMPKAIRVFKASIILHLFLVSIISWPLAYFYPILSKGIFLTPRLFISDYPKKKHGKNLNTAQNILVRQYSIISIFFYETGPFIVNSHII